MTIRFRSFRFSFVLLNLCIVDVGDVVFDAMIGSNTSRGVNFMAPLKLDLTREGIQETRVSSLFSWPGNVHLLTQVLLICLFGYAYTELLLCCQCMIVENRAGYFYLLIYWLTYPRLC